MSDSVEVWAENIALPFFKCILNLSSRPLTRTLNLELPSLSVKELSLCSENIAKLELVATEALMDRVNQLGKLLYDSIHCWSWT